MGCFKFLGKLCSSRRQTRETRTVHSETRIGQILKIRPRKPKRMPTLGQILKTSVPKSEIEKSEYTPRKSQRKKYRFRCSICYSFFSNIMECSKWSNYIWVFDLEKYFVPELGKRINPMCPFWSCAPVCFKDVDPAIDKVKHYFSSSESWSSKPLLPWSQAAENSPYLERSESGLQDSARSSIRNFSAAVKRNRFESLDSEEEKVPLNHPKPVFDYQGSIPHTRTMRDSKRKKKIIKPGKIQRLNTGNLDSVHFGDERSSARSLRDLLRKQKEKNQTMTLRKVRPNHWF